MKLSKEKNRIEEVSEYHKRYYNLLQLIKKNWYKIGRQFTVVELAVILALSIMISIGIYKGFVWMILKSSMGSTFYRVMMTG
jgi:hypothetical protein